MLIVASLKPVLKDSPPQDCEVTLYLFSYPSKMLSFELLAKVLSFGILVGCTRLEYDFFFASKFAVKYAVFPDRCWEFLQSPVGLLDFISWPTSGTFDIYSAPGREDCC